jgi:glycerate 2-kinase
MESMDNAESKKLVTQIFNASLESVDPYESVKKYADKIYIVYQEGKYTSLYLIGLGKAACPMAKAIEENLPDITDPGIVITKYGHNIFRKSEAGGQKSEIKIYEAGHPVPDENGQGGTKEIVSMLKQSDENTLVLCLISGGGSALLVDPYDGITLDEKKKITDLLLKAGADIFELNTVRKHISNVKGGRLAEIAWPAKIMSLILSDVIGDRLDIIASGPTSPDSSTFNDALRVLEKYKLTEQSPSSVMKVLYDGTNGLIPETPKEGNKIFEKVENIVIGSNKKALEAARTKAESLGLKAEIISTEITGEAREVGKWLAKKALAVKSEASGVKGERKCFISGGETTVAVKGNGIGGRNMELALSFAMEIEGIDGITLLSAGTDGTDGPTDAAGAIVNGNTVQKARDKGLMPEEFLWNNDTYHFFKEIDELLVTGPTGTNVMDIQLVIVESQ